MTTTALQLSGANVITPAEWQDMKQDALMAGTLIEFVNDVVSNNHAVAVQSDIHAARKVLEQSRVKLKAPVIALGKLIDATAAKEDVELEKEEKRVQALINDFQALELSRAKAAENARRLEEERLERERLAEIQRMLKAEEDTRRQLQEREAEALQAVKQATNAAESAAAAEMQREIDRQKELATAESLEKQDAINEKFNEASAALPQVEMHRAEGQRVVEAWEVTVLDVWTLARVHPGCVKIEPLTSEIKKLLDLGVKVHGVTAKKVVSSTTTSRKVIDI